MNTDDKRLLPRNPYMHSLHWVCVLAVSLVSSNLQADSQPIVHDDVTGHTILKHFKRLPSALYSRTKEQLEQSLLSPITVDDFPGSPMMAGGLPGVAIFDYDRDRDLDIYVTNGLGGNNGLFQNQLSQTGRLDFIDAAAKAGVSAQNQDSYGVCTGDIDNDGYQDLMVLGRAGKNFLYHNQGDGTFKHLVHAGVDGGVHTSAGCSMGDIDNDGFLDVVVANAFDQSSSLAIMAEPYALNEPNQLLRNNGNLSFSDVSQSSGLLNNGGYPAGAHGITWAVSMVDVDGDGDADIVLMDDQGGIVPARHGGIDRAYIHVFINDGTGHFVDKPIIQNEYSASEWMGGSFGDLNCDGHLDIFASSLGDYANTIMGGAQFKGGRSSRAFFGTGQGRFYDSAPPIFDGNGGYTTDKASTVFGWGNAVYDVDNDGDNDVLYHGGLEALGLFIVADNPGVLLLNKRCSGELVHYEGAFKADHLRRNVRAVAIGDIDRNGFVDVVTVANVVAPPSLPLTQSPASYGDSLDKTAYFISTAPLVNLPTEPPAFVWNGEHNHPGDIKLELNRGNRNHSVGINVLGSKGLTAKGRVNRDGVGARLSFRPRHGVRNLQAVVSGSSHSSNHALERRFGLGHQRYGTLDILWPGGVRNRLYHVRHGENLTVPEIPCSYDKKRIGFRKYLKCVNTALRDLHHHGVISKRMKSRLFFSALRARREHRHTH